jgi:hypothetical protein
MATIVDYGPLAALIGEWEGAEGLDVAPEPDGAEESPYSDHIVFQAVGDVTNAEAQTLGALHYHQVVTRKRDGKIFHNETGYYSWDPATKTVSQSLTIPRVVALLAGGTHSGSADGEVVIEVAARLGDPDWGILQSPFMRDNAKTIAFEHKIVIKDDSLSYEETTTVDIYGKVFAHTDANRLSRNK